MVAFLWVLGWVWWLIVAFVALILVAADVVGLVIWFGYGFGVSLVGLCLGSLFG